MKCGSFKKGISVLVCVLLCIGSLAACKSETKNVSSGSIIDEIINSNVNSAEEILSKIDTANAIGITLNGQSASCESSSVQMDGTKVTITKGGTYRISGTLSDGQIRVDSADDENVNLILSGADITCSSSAPIYILSAKNAVILLEDENTLTDGETYSLEEEDEPNAAIFSKDDLKILGDGSLTVNANYANGIQSKDDLEICSGTITVNAKNHGIKGKDSVVIFDGTISVTAGGDGIQASNTEDTSKGYINIEGGTLSVTAGEDGIQAETGIWIEDGVLSVTTGGGSANSSQKDSWGMWGNQTSSSDEASAKGIKAETSITITGGEITIDSSDDAIHSNNKVTIGGGSLTISSGDDGIHADSELVISDGKIQIEKSYEGIESAVITVSGGTTHIIASDDGANVAGGNDGSSMGRPGANQFSSSGNYLLTIGGGTLVIDAGGDGLDSNGSIEMTGGTVLVNGPTDNGNGAIDYQNEFNMSGGFLIAAGSSGMAQATSSSSSQNCVMIGTSQNAGTLIYVLDASGKTVAAFTPSKTYQNVVISSGDFVKGSTYTVYVGGSCSGTCTDGLYENGTCSGGNSVGSFTVSGSVSTVGSTGGSNGGGMGGGFGRR